jgi:Zn-dependent protease/predicted transcriptional regulator
MFGKRFPLFELFGFKVWIDASWLIIAVLVAWSLAAGVFPSEYPGLATGELWWMGILGALGLFASIILHELSHSLVARRYGLRMRGITLFVFGGVAEMEEEPPSARAEFMMAIAGPSASIVIGALAYLAARAGQGVWPVEEAGVLSYLAWINFIVAAFNLIPAFPLDGGRVLRSALWHWKGNLARATRIAASFGQGFALVLMGLAVVQLLSGNLIGAIWWFVLGLFLRDAARSSYQQLVVNKALEGQPVQRFMTPDPITVRPDLSIQELVDDYIYRHHHKMFPVVNGSQRLIGSIALKQVKEIPREQWPSHRVGEFAQPCSPENTIPADTGATQALSLMNKTGASRLMVTEDGHLVAVVTLKDLMGFLSTKLDLEGDGRRG